MVTEKDYCDYETCVALKELGLNNVTEARLSIRAKVFDLKPKPYIELSPKILLYEAQKWLREEKKIEIVVLGQDYIGGPYYPDIYTEDGLMNNAKGYKTYEEALSEGIKEAVKILKEIGNGE